jgi:hypothetical protein
MGRVKSSAGIPARADPVKAAMRTLLGFVVVVVFPLYLYGGDGTRVSGLGAHPGPRPHNVAARHRAKTIDGLKNDWDGPALWQEGGEDVESPGFRIDIKQVHVSNDSLNFYVLMRCTPTIARRFETQALGGRVGDLYFDTDDNRRTGSVDAELGIFGYGSGYERKVSIEIGTRKTAGGGEEPFVRYTIRAFDRAELDRALARIGTEPGPYDPVRRQIARRTSFWKEVEGGRETSLGPDARIAHAEDGLEMALPMTQLGVKPGHRIRLLLAEEAQDFVARGYGVRYHTAK